MAELTFQARVESLTSISIATSPSPTELTQFLIDACNDIARKMKDLDPTSLDLYATVAVDQDAAFTVQGLFLYAELRDGTAGVYHMCEEISPRTARLYLDTNSLYKATYINPKSYIIEGAVKTIPAMTSVYEMNVAYFIADTTLDYNSTTIIKFPKNMYHAVALYASILTVENYMSNELVANKDSDMYKLAMSLKQDLTRDYESIFATLIKQREQK